MATFAEKDDKKKKHWIVKLEIAIFYDKNYEDREDIHRITYNIRSISLKNAQRQARKLAKVHRGPIMAAGWGGVQNLKYGTWGGRTVSWHQNIHWECNMNIYRQRIDLSCDIDADLQEYADKRAKIRRKEKREWKAFLREQQKSDEQQQR